MRDHLLGKVFTSLVGCLVTLAFMHCVRLYRERYGSLPHDDSEVSTDIAMDDNIVEDTVKTYADLVLEFSQRFWKLGALVALMLSLEVIKGYDQGSNVGQIFRFEAFRDTLRRLVRGQGLPPLASTTLESEKLAEQEANAAAAYANAWEHRRRARHID